METVPNPRYIMSNGWLKASHAPNGWLVGGKECKDKQKERGSPPSHSLFLFRIIPLLAMRLALHGDYLSIPTHSCVWRL